MYAAAFRNKRRELGVDANTPGILIHDAFTGNTSGREACLRQKFCSADNIKIFSEVPGGWSANGQPCDAIHQYYRSLNDSFQTVSLGMNRNPLLRQRLQDLTHTASSFGKRSLSWQSVIDCDIWSWQNLPLKLHRYAWVSRGYLTYQEMADVSSMTAEEVETEEASAKDAYKNIMSLTAIPNVAPLLPERPSKEPLVGESIYMWQMCTTPLDQEGGPGLLAILEWSNIAVGYWSAVEREVAKFKRDQQAWEKRLEKRLRTV